MLLLLLVMHCLLFATGNARHLISRTKRLFFVFRFLAVLYVTNVKRFVVVREFRADAVMTALCRYSVLAVL